MKTFAALFIFGFIIFICGRSVAQNLVANGSFEEFSHCPNSTAEVDSCIGWHGYGGLINFHATPDYFSSCAPPVVSVPENYFGTQASFDGNSYMGIYTFDYSSWYREIIGAQLIDTLISGNSYHISMRLSRGNETIYQTDACVASNNMGIRFTTYDYPPDIPPLINNYAQLFEDSIITDTLGWVLLHWNFIADSNYSHVFIGNFFDSQSTDTMRIKCPVPPGAAYYFIDSVNILCQSENCATGVSTLHDESSIFIFPNPANDVLKIRLPNMIVRNLEVRNEMNNTVIEKQVLPNDASLSLNVAELPGGIYLLTLHGMEKDFQEKFLVIH